MAIKLAEIASIETENKNSTSSSSMLASKADIFHIVLSFNNQCFYHPESFLQYKSSNLVPTRVFIR